MRKIYILLMLFVAPFLHGQLSTNGGMSPNQLVQNVLVGQGVTVSNVSYSGSNGAIGSFQAANTSLGIDEGIILTTGTINSGPDGPYGPNNKSNAGLDNFAGGYGPLTNLVGTNTYNAAILEFDFVPKSDSVKFEYVFGSEEYPEWVGDQFNDVFAFFISGPGIPGGTKNMALIPGTIQPVAINNVNNGTANNGPCQNCAYYVNNGNGSNAPFKSNPFYIQYDGFTVPLEASSAVECGETYHLIIAIADVGDAIYDSGIFLTANSLSSEQPVNVDYTLSNDPYGDSQTMAQGCTSTTVTVTRSGNETNLPLTIPINIAGSAIQGTDYSNIPSEINFAANHTEVTFTFDALNNPGVTGTINILLEFEIQDPCGDDNFEVLELFINPVDDVEVVIESSDILCPGDEIELIANASGGGGGYDYLWSTGETSNSIFVNPEGTEVFTVEVTDNCLNQTAIDQSTVEVPIYDDLQINVTENIEEDCPFVPFDLTVEAIGGAENFTYEWSTNSGNVISNSAVVTVIPNTTTTYYIAVTDQCGEFISDSVTITILSPPLTLEISAPQEICPGDSVEITVTPSGGFGDYYYFWPHSEETTATVTVSPNQTTVYEVVVKDDCQTFQVVAESEVVVVSPDANFQTVTTPMFIDLPITFQNLTNNGNIYEWYFGDGNTSNLIHPNNTFLTPGTYPVTLIASDLKGCTDTITKQVVIEDEYYIYIPNSFTPDGDRFNNYFEASTVNIESLTVQIFNRWGELVFASDEVDFSWDGSYNGQKVRDGTYVWKLSYVTRTGIEGKLNGHVTALR